MVLKYSPLLVHVCMKTKEGIFKDHPVPNSARRNTNGFQKLIDRFFKQSGLPFAEVITATKIEEVFRKHGGLFGLGSIYSTATVLWAFFGQVLQDGKMAACRSAVAGIIAHRQLLGQSERRGVQAVDR